MDQGLGHRSGGDSNGSSFSVKPGNYLKNIGMLSSGTALGQACVALAMPVISRIYSPAEFGVLGVYMSTLGLLSVVAMFRYEVAVPLGESAEEAVNLMALGLAIAFAWAVLGMLILGAVYWVLPAASPWRKFVVLLPLGILSTGVYQALSFWAVRQQDYGTLVRTRLTQSLGMALSQIGFGLLRFGSIGLLLGHLIGQSGGIGALSRTFRGAQRGFLRSITRTRMAEAAWKFRRFPLFSSWAALLNASLEAIPLLFLASRFPPEVGGWYTLGLKIMVVPGTILTTSLGQVHYGEFARVAKQGTAMFKAHFRRRSLQIWAATILFATPLVVLAAWLIPILFGPDWKGAVTVIQVMGPAFLFNLATSSFGCVLDVMRRQDLHLVREVVRVTALGCAAVVCAGLNLAWTHALMVFSGVSVMSSIWAYSLSRYAIMAKQPQPSRPD